MQFPYGRFAAKIVTGALLNGRGGELQELVQLHGEAEEIEFLLDVEKGSRRLVVLRRNVVQLMAHYEERSMVAPLEQSDVNPSFFILKFEDDPGLDDQERDLRARYRLQPSLVAELQSLDASAFEQLCRRILDVIGCTSSFVTRQSKDEGADFFGRLPAAPGPAPGDLQLTPITRVLGALSRFLFGQAKRYGADNKVDVDVIRAMPGTWLNILNELTKGTLAANLKAGLEAVAYDPADTVILMVATTSTFTPPARKTGANLGMVLMDGEQIAQLLLEDGLAVQRDALAAWRVDASTVAAFCTSGP